jgi:hypothetical protein
LTLIRQADDGLMVASCTIRIFIERLLCFAHT